MHARRRVRKDGTVDIAGVAWQLDQGFLAGCLVTIAVDTTGAAPPVVEHNGRRYVLHPVDAVAAGKTRRPRPVATWGETITVPYDPAGALLDRLAGRGVRLARSRWRVAPPVRRA